MRVGIFTESYYPLINGVSTSVHTLMAELERAGHTVFIITSQFPNYRDERPGIYRFPSINSLVEPDYVLPIPISPYISAALPKLKLDIVHSQSPFLLGLLAARVAKRYGLPHISTNHTLYTEYAHYMPLLPSPMTKSMLTDWMRTFYNKCDLVLAPSHMTKDRLVEGYGVTTPVSVVPTGIQPPPYILVSRAATRRELGLPEKSRILLYVGRLAPEKNLETLIEAFARVARQTKDTYLVLAGSGKSHSALQFLAEQLEIDKRIVFTGFLPRTKLDPLYRSAEIFLFPSKTDTQGLVVGEALAAGTPCIVVNGGGVPESIRDGVDGFLVEDNPEAMATRTLQLLSDPGLRSRMSENAIQGAKNITPERIAERVIAIYESVIAGKVPADLEPEFTQLESKDG